MIRTVKVQQEVISRTINPQAMAKAIVSLQEIHKVKVKIVLKNKALVRAEDRHHSKTMLRVVILHQDQLKVAQVKPTPQR